MVEISLRLNEWKFILEDGEPRSLLTPNLHVVGFMNCPPVHTDSDDYDLILDGLMPCLQRFPMLRAMAIIFYGYKGLSLGMSPYRPLPFHPLIQNNQYVLVIRRINHGWLELLDFPEVVPLPPKGKADCIGIHPITLLPTGMSLYDTSNIILLISCYMDRSEMGRLPRHYPVIARNSRSLSIMVALSPPNIHEPRDRVLPP